MDCTDDSVQATKLLQGRRYDTIRLCATPSHINALSTSVLTNRKSAEQQGILTMLFVLYEYFMLV